LLPINALPARFAAIVSHPAAHSARNGTAVGRRRDRDLHILPMIQRHDIHGGVRGYDAGGATKDRHYIAASFHRLPERLRPLDED
jgi:hypothetical protein